MILIIILVAAGGLKDSSISNALIDSNTGQAMPRTVACSSSAVSFHNPNNVMANMETLLESMNTGNWQNFDISQWQSLMESMKDIDVQNMGLDSQQWQELAFSFSQYLQSQGVMRDNGSPMGTASNLSSPSSSSLQVNSPHYSNGASPLQGSHTSYGSNSSYGSTHSVPNIRVIPAMPQPTQRPPQNMDDDEEEETFDWDSIM